MTAAALTGKSRNQLIYWAALAAMFAFAIWRRVSLPLDPIADPDTWGYLAPALRKLTGAQFGHTYGRNFLYPGFLFLVLRMFGDFRAITIAQHALGVMAAGIFVITWRRLRVFVPDSRINPVVHNGIGLFGAATHLLANQSIVFEKQIRPEGVCAFVLAINLYALVRFTTCLFIERRQRAAVAFGIAVAFTALLLASIKPSFWFAAIVDLALLGSLLFRRDWWREKIAIGVGAIISAALLLIPEHFLARHDEMSRTFLSTTLFVTHANLIRDQIAADLNNNAVLPYPRSLLEQAYAALRDEIAKSRAEGAGSFRSFDFDPNYLMYNESSLVAQLPPEFGGDADALCAFYRFYYWRTWQQRPVAMLGKIARQLSIFYAPKCPVYDWKGDRSLAEDYGRTILSLGDESYRKVWIAYSPASDFMERVEQLSRNAPIFQQPRVIRLAMAFMAISYVPWLLIATPLTVFVLMRPDRRKRLGGLGRVGLFLFLFNFASCLEVAVVSSLDVRRYVFVMLLPTLLAQLTAGWFILEFVFEKRRLAGSAE